MYIANNIACKRRMTMANSQQFKTRKNLFYKYTHLGKIVTDGNIELWHLYMNGKLVSKDFPTFHPSQSCASLLPTDNTPFA